MGIELSNNFICYLNGHPINLNHSITLRYPKIKRKKLINLLVKYGYQLKYAKQIVWRINKCKIQYGYIYFLIANGGDLSFLNFINTQIKN